jgi:protein gp37
MNNTSINWTDKSSNLIRARRLDNGKVGHFCTKKNSKCVNCYAEEINNRFGTGLSYDVRNLDKIEWFFAENEADNLRRLNARLAKQNKTGKVFLSSMTDLFHEDMPVVLIKQTFELIRDCPNIIFQTLTKRINVALQFFIHYPEFDNYSLQNLWFGITPDDEGKDILHLRKIGAPVRWLSLEPLLKEFTLSEIDAEFISWIVVGGESGSKARPFNIQWARYLAHQCQYYGIPLWFKQTGNKAYLQERAHLPIVQIKTKGKGENIEDFPDDLKIREFPQ